MAPTEPTSSSSGGQGEDKAQEASKDQNLIDALIEGAADLIQSMPGKDPTSGDLYKRVKTHFRKEDDMLRFVGLHWSQLPTVVPIADNGPGFYISSVPIRRKDCFDPVPHDIRVSKPIPTFYEVKNKLVKWEGMPTAISTIVSRTTGRLVMEHFQKACKADLRKDALKDVGPGATMVGGSRMPVKGKAKARAKEQSSSSKQPYRPRWWEGVLIVLGTKPTIGERAFYKWAQHPEAPVPLHLYADGDVTGLNVAKSLITSFDIGHRSASMVTINAEWQGAIYRELIAASKAHDRRERGKDDPQPYPGSRPISKEPESVRKEELERWCETPEVPKFMSSYSDFETAGMAPLGQTARELRDGGSFFRLVSVWHRVGPSIAYWAEGFQKGLEEYRERQKGGR